MHRDHYTQAVVLRRETGATVSLGRDEQPTLAVMNRTDRGPLENQVEHLRRMGAPALAEATAAAVADHRVNLAEWEAPDVWLDAGELALPGGRALHAVPTPGHTAGHLVFHDTDGALLFAGDHVLPTITPSIGFEPVLSPEPLGAFLRSLALVRSRPDAMLLPAHGPVTGSVHARVDELVAHHGRRLDQAEQAAGGSGRCAAEVAALLRWTRHERTLDELDRFNQMLAIFETGAHLDLLAAQGRLQRDDVDGVLRYR